MVQQVDTVEEFEAILKQNDKVVVDFYAQWCGPCKQVAPHVAKLEEVSAGVKFIKIDCDVREMMPIVAKFAIEAMPTFAYIHKGEEVAGLRILGAKVKEIASNVKELLARD